MAHQDIDNIRQYRGGVAFLGPSLTIIRDEHIDSEDSHDSTKFPLHITLLTKKEYVSCGRPPIPDLSSLDIRSLKALGLGRRPNKRPDVTWIVLVWHHAQRWRRSLGLEPAELHISVTENNYHTLDKGLGSLVDLHKLQETWSEDTFDHVLLSPRTALHDGLANTMVRRFPDSGKAWVRLADASRERRPKLAMLAYLRALSLRPDVQDYIRKQLARLSKVTSWGVTLTPEEAETTSGHEITISDINFASQVSSFKNSVWMHTPEPRHRVWLRDRRLPRFFTWILPNRLAAMSTPTSLVDIDCLQELGITTILTLTCEEPLPQSWFRFKKIKSMFVPVENYKAPSLAQMDHIHDKYLAVTNEKWLVHCGGGKGRAGTVLACLLSMLPFDGSDPGQYPARSKSDVIGLIRQIRPGSIETTEQEDFVGRWIQHRWKVGNEHAASEVQDFSETELLRDESPAFLANASQYSKVTHIMLVGLPGAGKSWLAQAIERRRRPLGQKTMIISQDEGGSRSACETAFGRSYPSDMLVILDRCNATREDRQSWLRLLPKDAKVIAVAFRYPLGTLRKRIAARLGHPTIPIGSTTALISIAKTIAPPTPDEDFEAILTVRSPEAAASTLELLTKPLPLLKFPRTPHILNLGAATEDDVTLSAPMAGRLVIEEKIDGANVGFSFSRSGRLLVQNRSHWICSADHAQFKPLDRWIDTHLAELRDLLFRDEGVPERYVLYGEWVVAKHSIHYTDLPDRFLAFDLLDRVEGKFVARNVLEGALRGRGIEIVPKVMDVEEGMTMTVADWKALIRRKSAFYDGEVEGVYVRTESRDGLWAMGRGKVVRSDFLAGDQHWTRQGCVLNGVMPRDKAS